MTPGLSRVGANIVDYFPDTGPALPARGRCGAGPRARARARLYARHGTGPRAV